MPPLIGSKSIRYMAVKTSRHSDDLLEICDDDESHSTHDAPQQHTWRHSLSKISRPVWLGMNMVLFICSVVLATTALVPGYERCYGSTGGGSAVCTKMLSMASPILDDIEVTTEQKQMSTTFVPLDPNELLRMEPSPEVDRAWQSLVDSRPVPIDRDTVVKIGKDPSQSVRIPESWGYGSDMYFGRVDVFHQIHCLDALRREAHFEHYYGATYPFGYNDTGEFHRTHLSHCLHLLLENIMCNANTDMYTHIWVDNLEHPWPDFQLNHQCRNFTAVQEWQEKHALDEDAFVDLERPAGYAYRTTNEEFKRVNGWFKNHSEDHIAKQGSPA